MYQNWDESSYPANETFCASIAKIDEQLRRQPLRWALSAADRVAYRTDWKPGKLAFYRSLILLGDTIGPPCFKLTPKGTNADIVEGRHRIYAFHEAGYDRVLVWCEPEVHQQLQTLIGV